MSADVITARVEQFVLENIGSVAELELLLLLYKHATREWSDAELAEELRIDPAWAGRRLDEMSYKGLLVRQGDPMARYCYSVGSPAQDSLMAALAQCYEKRRVSIVTLIYSKPKDHIRSFADAFRLREDK
jgi:hypothetical protein